MIPTIHWSSPSIGDASSSISPISTSTSTTNNNNAKNNLELNSLYLRNNFKRLDEGCYGSSDMSGDSIDALTVNNKNKSNENVSNKNNNYCGIYNLNSTTKTCLIDADVDDSVSNEDSAIQTTILNEQFDFSRKHQQQQEQCSYQLERFEKLYYNDDNSVNVTVTKHLNRNPQVRGSFV